MTAANANVLFFHGHRRVKPVKNEELWKRLELATELHDVSWEWIKGHAGHFENEQADELARNGMEPFKS